MKLIGQCGLLSARWLPADGRAWRLSPQRSRSLIWIKGRPAEADLALPAQW